MPFVAHCTPPLCWKRSGPGREAALLDQGVPVRINDRLAAPNDEPTFAALRPELEQLGARLFAGPFELRRAGDTKALFGVTLKPAAAADLDTLLGRLGGPP